MVNPRSTLYAEHPDWVVGQPARPRREWRQQLVLDVLQPAVADFVLDVVDRTLAENPGISYLKWDANRPLTDPGSPALATDRQANYWVDHVRATWDLMATVAERHPEQTLMLCASGGGRVDLGSLRWFHEVWLSDNTDPGRPGADAVGRLALPPGQRGGGPRHRVGRAAPRVRVRGGHECTVRVRPRPDGAQRAKTWPSAGAPSRSYRDVRPLVQQGDLWRLLPPDERAALSYVSPDGQRAVVFAFQLADGTVDTNPVQLGGLDADRQYAVTSVDLATPDDDVAEQWSGTQLMERGLAWPLTAACTARVLVLRST